jgi:hypothetical protein
MDALLSNRQWFLLPKRHTIFIDPHHSFITFEPDSQAV